MNRLFRQSSPSLTGYAGLALFAVIYLAAVALVVMPSQIPPEQGPAATTD